MLMLPPAARAGSDAALVDCTFPGQVRRLGAYATTVTPRRQARVTATECRYGGGEYVETLPVPAQSPGTAQSVGSAQSAEPPHASAPSASGTVAVSSDVAAALNIWLPVAQAGGVDAQVTVGEIHDRLGDFAQARIWYEKAAMQGSPRAKVNLASLYERGAGMPRDAAKAQLLILQAAGLPAATGNGLRIELIDPAAAIRLPRTPGSDGNIVVDGPPGPLTVTGRAESPSGIASISNNGKPLAYDANGTFAVPVLLGDEPAALKISATDQTGGAGQAEFVLRRSAAGTSTPGPAPASLEPLAGKRLALVIANQNYQRWEKLDTPVADAKAVGDVLRSRFGFEVVTLTDTTRKGLLQALNQLRMTAGPDDQVIVFYAGHGQMDPATARGYWIPIDGDIRDLSNWVSVIDVTDQLSALQARHVLVIADSCYSGTLAGSLSTRIDAALSSEQRQRHLTQLSTRRARVAFTSGGLEPVADGGGEGHSLFVRSLLDVLAQVQAPVGAQELSRTVSARFSVLGRALKVSQQPQYAPIAFAGHEAGDFVLAPRR
ncbi:MAG TPA: caspase family protein [Burkholderiaceae bacterium]|nr:caspase family protein [Burkholderiaceae bacterium]